MDTYTYKLPWMAIPRGISTVRNMQELLSDWYRTLSLSCCPCQRAEATHTRTSNRNNQTCLEICAPSYYSPDRPSHISSLLRQHHHLNLCESCLLLYPRVQWDNTAYPPPTFPPAAVVRTHSSPSHCSVARPSHRHHENPGTNQAPYSFRTNPYILCRPIDNPLRWCSSSSDPAYSSPRRRGTLLRSVSGPSRRLHHWSWRPQTTGK